MTSFETQTNIIDNVISRICHDLIGPFGTAQLALENKDLEIAQNCIQQAIAKLEIFRSIFKTNVNYEKAIKLIEDFIQTKDLQCEIKETKASPALIFFLIQKMISKSEAIFEFSKISLKNFFFTPEEIDILQGKIHNITPGTTMAYLAYIQFYSKNKLEIKKLEENNWTITIKNA
jgi:hypothetical protein